MIRAAIIIMLVAFAVWLLLKWLKHVEDRECPKEPEDN